MAERQALRYQVLDSSGVPIAGANIQVAQLDTTTDITQTMYAGLTGATTIANPLVSDASGWVQAYFDGTDAVALKRVTVIPTKTGFTFTTRNVQLGSDYGVLDDGVAPIKATSVEATDRFNMARGSAGDPASLQVGDMWYNTTTNTLQWENNTGTQTVSSTTGDITGVTAGDGLTGGGASGDVTLDVGDGNAIVASADAVDVSVNAASSAAAALAGDDKILISDTDDSNTTKSATISQINPTMLDGGNNKVYYTDSSGNVTELALGSANQVLTSAGATSAPTFTDITGGSITGLGNDKVLYTNNSGTLSEVALGANGTVLQSTGTTSAPAFAAAAAGGVYTANSSAAITNGHIAVLDPAGTVSPVGTMTAAGPPSTATITAGTATIEPMAQNSTVWDEDTNTLFVLAASTSTIQLIPCTVEWTSTNPTVTAGTPIASSLSGVFYNGGMAMYDKLNNKIVVAGRSYSTSTVQMQTGTVSGSGSTATISWDTMTSVTGYAPSYIWLTYMRSGPAYSAGATVALTCANNASGYRESIFFDVSGSSPSALATYNNGSGLGTKAGQPVCDGTGNLKWPYIDTGGTAGYGTFYYGSGWMGPVSLPAASTWGNWVDMAWDETNNRGAIAVCNTTSPGGSVYVWEVNDTGAGTGSFVGSDINWGSVYTGYMNTYNTSSCFFDAFSGTCMIWWVENADRHYWTPVTLTGSQVSAGTASATSAAGWARNTQPYGASLHHAYASGTNLNFAAGIFSGSSSTGTRNSFSISNAYLSTNENAWLGVAKNTTTGSGQSQEVYVIGGVANEGLSGLTIGDNYYVQSNGQLGTTNTGGDRLVGKAITADKILVENTGTGTA